MEVSTDKVVRYKNEVTALAGTLPNVAEAYHGFTGECFAAGELDERTKQLIALGISMFANNEVCTYYHVQEALAKGATDRQIMEAAAVAAAAASGHAMSQGVIRVQGALEGHARHAAPEPSFGGMQDYLQDTEFAGEIGRMNVEYGSEGAVSPSY
ncbi:carboxymuconolactone decarboxylase family protein [Cohnella sp. CFH 77786]|nr:carboxymuconolactone decarboxylase family protein [Cohnella sp. CFH 77786]